MTFKNSVFAALSAGLVMLGPVAVAHSDTKNPDVQYRMAVMESMGADALAISLIAKQQVSQMDNLAEHAAAIALHAKMAASAFKAKIVDGEAKAEIWDNWADFEKRLNKLGALADDVAATARDKGAAAALPKLGGLFNACGNCHDIYREEE